MFIYIVSIQGDEAVFFSIYLFIEIHNLSNLDIWWNFLTVILICWFFFLFIY